MIHAGVAAVKNTKTVIMAFDEMLDTYEDQGYLITP